LVSARFSMLRAAAARRATAAETPERGRREEREDISMRRRVERLNHIPHQDALG
jgi:hypothetical protein